METTVNAFVGNLEVIGTGMVHTSDDQRLNLIIGGILEMEFTFVIDNQNKEFRTNSRIEGNKLIWELVNYTNPLGTGVLIPVELGTLKARKLYITFYVWTPNPADSHRIINYVIYLEKEA